MQIHAARTDDSDALPQRPIRRLAAAVRVHRELEEVGFAVVGPTLLPDDIDQLEAIEARVVSTHGANPPWFTTGMIADRFERRALYEAVGAVVRPRLETHVVDDAAVLAGHLHINPVHDAGGLGPHQDVAVVDESTSSSLNGWISLTDSSEANGSLKFVPGSHRWGNLDRSLAVDWTYEGLDSLFRSRSVRVDVPAGWLVLFDTATIHCSTPNYGPVPRVAANCVIYHSADQLLHLVGADDGGLDVYRIGAEFLIEGDMTGRPDGDEAFVGRRAPHRPDADPARVAQRCAAGLDLHRRLVDVDSAKRAAVSVEAHP